MAPSKLREALGSAKDQTTIGLARAGSPDVVSADLEVAIVRATAHGEGQPPDDCHVQEILALTCYSRARVAACVASVSRRLGRTRAWPVALKALALVHRLLAEGDPAFEQEVFLATTRRGRRLLDMSRFGLHERARSSAWGFFAFVRAYAAYLDDRLKLRMQSRGGGGGVATSQRKWCLGSGSESLHDTNVPYTAAGAWVLLPGHDHKPIAEASTGELIARAQQLKHLLDRAIDCRPMGKARTNAVVAAALCMLVKDSAAMYCELTEAMAALVDRFADLDTPGCVRVHSAFTSLAKTIDELDDLYYWCTVSAVCRSSDVPDLERVQQKKLDLMDEFIRDRHASASRWWSHSPPAPPLSPPCPCVETYDVKAETEAASKQQKFAATHENDNSGNAATAESALDDEMVDFLNLNEGAAPRSGKGHAQNNLALTLLDGDSAESAPRWVAFATGATVVNAGAFAGSASSVAVRLPGATMLTLQPQPGANLIAATTDPFAASLAVPPPTYVQMANLQTRQMLLVEEQMAWQQYAR
jgi:hypothetical protein